MSNNYQTIRLQESTFRWTHHQVKWLAGSPVVSFQVHRSLGFRLGVHMLGQTFAAFV